MGRLVLTVLDLGSSEGLKDGVLMLALDAEDSDFSLPPPSAGEEELERGERVSGGSLVPQPSPSRGREASSRR